MTNKPVKLSINGRRQGYVDLHRTPWGRFKYNVVVWFKRIVKWSMIVGGIGLSTYFFFPHTQLQTVEAVKEVEMQYPVLDRIAKAESYNSQFCTKEIVAKKGCHSYEVGAVLIHVNNNGSYDIGKYAINSTHLSEALALNYDVYQENGNAEFAKYLFRNHGSEPWSASKINWNK